MAKIRGVFIWVAVVLMLAAGIWSLALFNFGALRFDIIPSGGEQVILVRAGTDERVAETPAAVKSYIFELGPDLKIDSYTREERLPFSRFLPVPHQNEARYRVDVTFNDEAGVRYTAAFSGAIGFETGGLASPRYISKGVAQRIDSLLSYVFQASPAALNKGEFVRHADRGGPGFDREFHRTVLLGLLWRSPFMPLATWHAYDGGHQLEWHFGVWKELPLWERIPWRMLGFLQIPLVAVGLVRVIFWSRAQSFSRGKSWLIIGLTYLGLTFFTNLLFMNKTFMIFFRGGLL